MEKLTVSLNKNRSKGSINMDIYTPIHIKIKESLIVDNSFNETINAYKEFENERNACSKYNFNITINPYLTNILCDKVSTIINKNSKLEVSSSGDTSAAIQNIDDDVYDYHIGYDIFDNNFERLDTFKTGETISEFTGSSLFNLLSINDSINKNIIYDNGWICIENKCKIGGVKMFKNKNAYEKIDLSPTREYFSINPNVIDGVEVHNWSIMLTYPYSSDKDNALVSDESGTNGIPIVDSYVKTINNREYIFISTPYKHGLKHGDTITIHSTNRAYIINDTGDEDGNKSEYTFSIDKSNYSDIGTSNTLNGRISRVTNGVNSVYYFRKFKKLPENKSEGYGLAFSQTIYGEKIYQIQNTEDIDLSDLRDNLGRPISDIYVTIVKNSKDCNTTYRQHNSFGSVSSGINSPFRLGGYSNVRMIDGLSDVETGIEAAITGTSQDIFYGDIAEYNPYTVNETILDEVFHRFNTSKREKNGLFIYHDIKDDNSYGTKTINLNPYNEGYIYKPHYKIILKRYSNVLSTDKMYGLKIAQESSPSGITNNGTIRPIESINDMDVSYVILKTSDHSLVSKSNRVRVTKKINDAFHNLSAYVYDPKLELIAIKYDSELMGLISSFDKDKYTFKVIGSSSAPDYAQDRHNGTCAWRNIEQEGYFDAKSNEMRENTFSNGRFYVSNIINFYLKRQDPTGKYGLKRQGFPSDYDSLNIETPIEDKKTKPNNNLC